MEIIVPNYFIAKERRDFDLLLSCIDYMRDAYCGGVYFYSTVGPRLRDERFAVVLDNGDIWVDPAFFRKYVKYE